jgi:hypothetical protein
MRTGLQTFAKTVHKLCRLFGVFRGSIVLAVNATSLSSGDKAKLISLIETVDTACSAIDLIMIKSEK